MLSENINVRNTIIPIIGLGTYKLTGKEGENAIFHGLLEGYRHIDTAQFYNNEEYVGNAISKSKIAREDIFVTTKVWPSNFRKLIPEVETSLRKLKSEYVDLLLLHWPSDDETNKIGVELLNTAIIKGYAKNVGVSNFSIQQVKEALSIAPVICNQLECHPYLSQTKMLSFLKQQQMFMTAYSPLAMGKVSRDPILKEIGRTYNKTAGQVALRWLIQQESISVIPKASTGERRMENLQLFDFNLTEQEMKQIDKLSKIK